jgi:hypothetical protein
MEVPQIQAKPRRTQEWGAYYDAQGKRIDELYLPYTAVATKDPDFPVLVYVFVDIPEAAWLKGRQGEEEFWARYRIEGGEAIRGILAMAYDPKARRWVGVAFPAPRPPRIVHAVPAGSAEDLAKLFGLPLWRRSELLARAGLQDPSPGTVNPATIQPVGTMIVSPEGSVVERR